MAPPFPPATKMSQEPLCDLEVGLSNLKIVVEAGIYTVN